MVKHPKRVLVLYDLPELTDGHDDPRYLLDHEDRPTERDVARAIKRLGMDLSTYGIYNDIPALLRALQITKPDVVFNLCETYLGSRNYEGDIASLLELAGVAYTGSRPAALHLCKDKGATKKIAAWDHIPVPAFKVFPQDAPRFSTFQASFPLIVKPLGLEASEGISQASIVHDWPSCEERVSWVMRKFKSDVIVEEYIHGREIYVGVMADGGNLWTFPPRELFFKNLDKKEPMVATYKAKWDNHYRARWGVSTGRASAIDKTIEETLSEQSLRLFKSLGLRGYARFDWRLDENSVPVFIEVNPNPALSHDDDFAKAGKAAGFAYSELVAKIISSALAEASSAQTINSDVDQSEARAHRLVG